jgi:hypothetical protein
MKITYKIIVENLIFLEKLFSITAGFLTTKPYRQIFMARVEMMLKTVVNYQLYGFADSEHNLPNYPDLL